MTIGNTSITTIPETPVVDRQFDIEVEICNTMNREFTGDYVLVIDRQLDGPIFGWGYPVINIFFKFLAGGEEVLLDKEQISIPPGECKKDVFCKKDIVVEKPGTYLVIAQLLEDKGILTKLLSRVMGDIKRIEVEEKE